jgi:hypothetical protein
VVTRFKVARVSGWTVNPGSHGASASKRTQDGFVVLDRANCHHIVKEFRASFQHTHRGASLELEARVYARRLEREYP